MLEKVIENWTSRLDYIRASRGSHMPEIIFKMPIGTKNIELSAIPITLLSILNFLKLNPKNLVGSIKYGGGSVLAWGCKSATEVERIRWIILAASGKVLRIKR
ncbi:hypothetical protein TNCV_3009551 [Trichonephila clavipes]|nr:hypothetical protein TNCV_3009551 [Trichonephila clavipes]